MKEHPLITLPIYYDSNKKIILVGINRYRNAHFFLLNKVKKHYHNLISQQTHTQTFNRFRVHYKIYVKRKGTDGPNVRSILEKFVLDGLIECGVIIDDKIEYLVGDSTEYYYDKNNPRCEVYIYNDN